MKFGLGILLTTTLLSGLSSAALADVYAPQSKIAAVTVYPRGADVTRVVEIELKAGEHQLVLDNLPGTLDPQSVRVAGEAGQGVEIASVDAKIVPLQELDIDVERRRLEKEISDLADARVAFDQVIADAEVQRQFLLSLANKQLTPTSTTQSSVGIDPAALNGMLDIMVARLAQLAKSTQEARGQQKSIDEKIEELQIRVSILAPQAEQRTVVTVNLSAAQASTGIFKVSYRLWEASWQPYYDARLTTPVGNTGSRLDLVRRASVVQSTSESWENVALTLSTARPGGATAAPDVSEHELFIDQVARSKKTDAGADDKVVGYAELEEAVPALAASPVESKPKPEAVMQKQAAVALVGFQATYQISGVVNIDNSGTSKNVRISSESLEAQIAAITSPRFDTAAYLTASFKLTSDAPVLPGAVNLYRDGVYVGQGALPLLSKDQDAKLGFGADDLVKVERVEVNRRTGEEGILTSSNVEERAWDITVKNLHDFTMPVSVVDRIPFATSDDVTVADVIGMTAPTERNLDKRRGVVAWRFDIESKGEKSLKTGYKVTWPKAMQVGQID